MLEKNLPRVEVVIIVVDTLVMSFGVAVVTVAKIEKFVNCTGVCMMLVIVIVEAFPELLVEFTATVSNGRPFGSCSHVDDRTNLFECWGLADASSESMQ